VLLVFLFLLYFSGMSASWHKPRLGPKHICQLW